MAQADKMRAKATKDRGRAEHGPPGRAAARPAWRRYASRTRWPRCGSRHRRPCGKTPLTADGLSKSYGSLEIFTDVDLAVDRGSRVVVLGLNGAGKTTLLRMLAGLEPPDTGEVRARARPAARLLRAGARDARRRPHRAGAHALAARAADLTDTELRKILGAFLFSGDDVDKPAGVLSGGEKTRLALATLVCSARRTCCCWTSRRTTSTRSAGSRCSTRCARYPGAIVLVTHDEGAVEALNRSG